MRSGRSTTRLRNLRIRFWLEACLGVVGAALLLVTLLVHDWIEAAFGIDPDQGNGSLEWAIVGALFVATFSSIALARLEWRRSLTADASTGIGG